MSDLDGNVAIVTGASSGIGAALARTLSARGAKVLLAARRRPRLEEVEALCPGETAIVVADVTAPEDRERVVRSALSRWGRVDLLFNNAGLGAFGRLEETSEEDWREVLEVNVLAPVLLARAVLPVMAEQGRGTIVNDASIGGLLAHGDGLTQYVTSKHALVGFSRALARDLEGTRVRVLAACPHLTDTELFEAGRGAEAMAETVERYRSFMDTAEAVAEGIVDQLDADGVILFPTEKPRKAYERGRDL
jgi:NAD(P)-dependent dehydrogenase (short-subunit alcohol dehydrogenase family)